LFSTAVTDPGSMFSPTMDLVAVFLISTGVIGSTLVRLERVQ
jgi:hypothetical protein